MKNLNQKATKQAARYMQAGVENRSDAFKLAWNDVKSAVKINEKYNIFKQAVQYD